MILHMCSSACLIHNSSIQKNLTWYILPFGIKREVLSERACWKLDWQDVATGCGPCGCHGRYSSSSQAPPGGSLHLLVVPIGADCGETVLFTIHHWTSLCCNGLITGLRFQRHIRESFAPKHPTLGHYGQKNERMLWQSLLQFVCVSTWG